MATFSIESNGRLEKTAVYLNGETLGGIKEIFLNLDEDGTFDAIIQYQGNDNNIYNKSIFNDYLENIKTVDAPYTEEESDELNLLTIESNGNIENTIVLFNEQELDGLVNLFIHIKSSQAKAGGLKSLFSGKKDVPEHVEFRAEFTFRNEDGTIETEGVF